MNFYDTSLEEKVWHEIWSKISDAVWNVLNREIHIENKDSFRAVDWKFLLSQKMTDYDFRV